MISWGERPFRFTAGFLWLLQSLLVAALLWGIFSDRSLSSMIPSQENMEEVWAALWLTAWTSVSVLGLCFLFGVPTAYMLATRHFRGRVLLDSLVDIPMSLPPVVCGVAVLFAVSPTSGLGALLARAGIPILFHPLGIILVQTFIAVPYMIRHCREAFAAVPLTLTQAAMVAGASEGRIFFRLYLPLCLRPMVAGAITAWSRAVGEFGATLLIVGAMPFKTQTMAIALYVNGFMASQKDVMFFMALLYILIALSVMILLRLVTGDTARKTSPEVHY